MKLKQKQKAFISEYVANGGNGVQAALRVYDTEDYNTANQIASVQRQVLFPMDDN